MLAKYHELYKKAKVYQSKEAMVQALFVHPEWKILDVGCCGQGIKIGDNNWVHEQLRARAAYVFGIDIMDDINTLDPAIYHYAQQNAEDFDYQHAYDVVFAGDLIEHLSNPGLFLASAKKSMKPAWQLIVSTPNAFSMFNMIEKLFKLEPTVNIEHTVYFTLKTLDQLFERYDLEIVEIGFIKHIWAHYTESIFKKIQNGLYACIGWFTPKMMEDIVVIAKNKVA